MLVAADCLDILAVDSSRIALGEFLEAYEPRYHAACVEFETWDRDNGDKWTSEHERKVGRAHTQASRSWRDRFGHHVRDP